MMKRWHFQVFLALMFVATSILSFFGKIHFGGGLGDLTYTLSALGIALIYLVIALSFRKSNKITFLAIQLIFLIILIYFIYHFTLGRGPESPWNGSVFV